jgi:hypothetical protein
LFRDFVWRIGKPSRQFSNHTRLVHTSSILYWEIYVWGGLSRSVAPLTHSYWHNLKNRFRRAILKQEHYW